ncbi:hypothetical protein NY813_06800, partial [Escherichia coli]|nr:hypothetical protein [Escherichia coli]
ENQKVVADRIAIQKKIINLVLWFSQTEPDYQPMTPETKNEKVSFTIIKGEKRLFESSKHRPFIVGRKTSEIFKKVYKDLEVAIQNGGGSG